MRGLRGLPRLRGQRRCTRTCTGAAASVLGGAQQACLGGRRLGAKANGWSIARLAAGMTARQAGETAVLMGATLLTRLPFRSHYLYDLDSVNFALALERFDPRVHQPHPPGYFLYVVLGKLANRLVQDPNAALQAISLLASCGVAALIYLLATAWSGRLAGRLAAGIFLFSPLAWFHGVVALTYMGEAFFSALAGYLCWHIDRGEKAHVVPAAVALGLAAGFRPSSLWMLGPLLLFSLRQVAPRTALAGLGAFGASLMSWWLPMLAASGGLAGYLQAFWSLWRRVPARQTVFSASPLLSLARLATILGITLLALGCATLFLAKAGSADSEAPPRAGRFTLVWIAPALLFFTFVYLRWVNSGYLLVLLPPACVWLGLRAARWYRECALRPILKGACLALGAAGNLLIFLFAPLYCSYGEMRRFEAELQKILTCVPEITSPAETALIGFDAHFLGYRHAGYYLPEYLTVQFPEIPNGSAKGVFLMHNRTTRVVTKIPAGSRQRFLLFPLPASAQEYREYMKLVQARFPTGRLKTVRHRGIDFTMGQVADLSLLFPATAER